MKANLDNTAGLCPACPDASLHMAIHGFVLEECTKPAHERHLQALKVSSQACICDPACPTRSLHMAIHGFVLEEYTKPAHERHLQALKVASQAFFPAN